MERYGAAEPAGAASKQARWRRFDGTRTVKKAEVYSLTAASPPAKGKEVKKIIVKKGAFANMRSIFAKGTAWRQGIRVFRSDMDVAGSEQKRSLERKR